MDTDPTYYYYSYSGVTYSNQLRFTNIYLIPDLLLDIDPSIDLMSNLFSNDTNKNLKEDIINTAKNDQSIDFIKSSKFRYKFNYT